MGEIEEGVIAHMRGMILKLDPGSWEVGEDAEFKIEMAVNYYKLEIEGQELLEIDPLNYVRRINGFDVLAGQRRKLGL